MRTQINDYMAFAGNVYSDLFDLVIEYNTPALYPTSADNCTGYATKDELNSDCSTSGHTDCKSNRAMLQTFNTIVARSTTSLPILWTGHYTWEERTDNPKFVVQDGAFHSLQHSIMMLNPGNGNGEFSESDRVAHTVIHEMAHEFGVMDSYCLGGDGENCPENCYKHYSEKGYSRYCIMAEITSNIDQYAPEELFCDKCKSDIKTYLNATY